jgi:hypothetical protein
MAHDHEAARISRQPAQPASGLAELAADFSHVSLGEIIFA